MKRGEIWWALLPTPSGSEPGRRRPVLVVSADAFNRSAIRTVVVAALTSNERLASAPGNVRLTKRESGLSKVSVVNVSQLLTLDRDLLVDRVRKIQDHHIREVEAGLVLSLGLQTAH